METDVPAESSEETTVVVALPKALPSVLPMAMEAVAG